MVLRRSDFPGLLVVLACAGISSVPADAHFQEIIPSADVLPDGGTVSIALLFSHPFEGGPAMEMARPARLGVLAGGVVTDLLPDAVETPVAGVRAWTVERSIDEPGAQIFFVEPQPYWEPAEGTYIVHYAKVVVDGWASGEGWDALVGLPVEIRPLTRPTGLWTGNLFTGVVLKHGEPAPFAEIEVEFVNDGSVAAPNEAFVTQVIRADANGTFSYAMPKAGWWGFAALMTGDVPMTSPEGAEAPVEEGGLIWVRASDMSGG